MNFNFNNREQYLEQRKQWAARYLALSAEIRTARAAYREAQRTWFANRDEPTGYKSKFEMLTAQALLTSLRSQATQMLADLGAAKDEAQRQVSLMKNLLAA